MGKMMGPNEKKLAIRKFTSDAIPADGGITDGLAAIVDPNMPEKMKAAALWVRGALDILMDTHVYKDREEAAKAVLDEIQGRSR